MVSLATIDGLEVDPTKMEGSEQDITINQLQLNLFAQKMLKLFLSTSNNVR